MRHLSGFSHKPPFGPQAREWLDRHRKNGAWDNAVIVNTRNGVSAHSCLQYPTAIDRDARKLEDRLAQPPEHLGKRRRGGRRRGTQWRRVRPRRTSPVSPGGPPAHQRALAAPTCPSQHANAAKESRSAAQKAADPSRQSAPAHIRRDAWREPDDDVVVYRLPPAALLLRTGTWTPDGIGSASRWLRPVATGEASDKDRSARRILTRI